MRIIRADVLGFCAGVRRTVNLAREAAGRHNKRLFTMGPLIHNERVLHDLENSGFSVLDEEALPETLVNSITVIRAHGIGPQLRSELTRRGTEIIDATCPNVHESQRKAQELYEKGFTLFIAGEKKHGEVRGIQMFAPNSIVVEHKDEVSCVVKALLSRHNSEKNTIKTAIIAQTTISKPEYQSICAEIKRFFPDLTVYDTICPATQKRQDALAKLCPQVDAVIIAGDKASSNTRRLLAVAEEHGKPAWIVNAASALPSERAGFGIDKFDSVGLSAGTSTPDILIDEIEQEIIRRGV
ncbi:MAG: 4-hydroxy-3-methylbut-2-enyl diphosphate reductase [Spirochaetaceae bacterium]|jgi:4-hydroxy-3-methylbut-2-enyl diphosphate reductase|nr:4-hydroxy-3-methylbut-2-enyl diphosphate reductase [Spirochaetaceae bacterium]